MIRSRTACLTDEVLCLRTLEHLLLGALFLGLVAMLSLPAARGVSPTLGWVPLWLLGLPAASLVTARLLAWSHRDARAGAAPRTTARHRSLRQAARRPPLQPRRRVSRLLAAIVLR